MTTHAYSELYLDDAMNILGEAVEFAVCDLGYEPDEFFNLFITSGVASNFENGNPKFVTGMSGAELVNTVLCSVGKKRTEKKPSASLDKGREYWSGWISAYYQWQTNGRFCDMAENGLTLSRVMSMYILHEADVTKFTEEADGIISRNKAKSKTNLYKIRSARGLTQKQLSDASGVSLRMIQLYEQKQNDISKAQAGMVIALAKALGCEARELIE